MSKKERPKRGGHFVLTPTLLSEALVVGLAMQTAKQRVAAEDAKPKMPRKIGEDDSRLED